MAISDLRRAHLIEICKALTTYIENGHDAHLKTVADDEAVGELAEELHNKAAVVFTIDDWPAFRKILEPGSE